MHRNSPSSGSAINKIGIESICEFQEQVTLTAMPSSSATLPNIFAATISKTSPYKPLMGVGKKQSKKEMRPDNRLFYTTCWHIWKRHNNSIVSLMEGPEKWDLEWDLKLMIRRFQEKYVVQPFRIATRCQNISFRCEYSLKDNHSRESSQLFVVKMIYSLDVCRFFQTFHRDELQALVFT